MTADELQRELLAVLAAAQAPLTTSTLLAELNGRNASAARPIVIEQVYRALRVLANQGQVRRVRGHPGRAAHWAPIHPISNRKDNDAYLP